MAKDSDKRHIPSAAPDISNRNAVTVKHKPLPEIKKEIDEPPDKVSATGKKVSTTEKNDSKSLSRKQRDWIRWMKNFNLIYLIIVMMAIQYAIDILLSIFAPKVELGMQEPFFDVLRTLLFIVAGFVFAKLKK